MVAFAQSLLRTGHEHLSVLRRHAAFDQHHAGHPGTPGSKAYRDRTYEPQQ